MPVTLALGAVLSAAAASIVAAAAAGAADGPRTTQAALAASSPTPCPKPADPIAIQSVSISENPIRAGTAVSGTVVATCNVAAVTAQVGTFRVGLAKRSPGIFQTTVNVPRFVWPGHFDLVVTAIRTDGLSIHRSIPIVVRW